MNPVPRVSVADAFFLPAFTPGNADLFAGGGFGVVLSVNAKRKVCLVLMQSGAQGEIATPTVYSLLLRERAA